MNVGDAREQVHRCCLRLVTDRLVVGSAGNVSVRLDEHHAVVSAGGRLYEHLVPDDHPVVDLRDGSWDGPCKPTSELALHRTLLAELDSVAAIVHTHSRYAAAFAVATIGAGEWSVDHALGLDVEEWWGAVIAGVVGVGGGLLFLAVFWRPPKEAA